MVKPRDAQNRLLSDCPICGGRLHVTHLMCSDCGSELTGQFTANEYARLPEDKLSFLRVFLACRGNLKEVEAALGISYPTVRARLDQLLEALQLHAQEERAKEEEGPGKSEVLDALARGELSVEEAAKLLREGH